jgi:hypothetical protein
MSPGEAGRIERVAVEPRHEGAIFSFTPFRKSSRGSIGFAPPLGRAIAQAELDGDAKPIDAGPAHGGRRRVRAGLAAQFPMPRLADRRPPPPRVPALRADGTRLVARFVSKRRRTRAWR